MLVSPLNGRVHSQGYLGSAESLWKGPFLGVPHRRFLQALPQFSCPPGLPCKAIFASCSDRPGLPTGKIKVQIRSAKSKTLILFDKFIVKAIKI